MSAEALRGYAADKMCDRRPPMPKYIDKKLDQMVRSNYVATSSLLTNTEQFIQGLSGQKVSAERAFAELTRNQSLLIRATVDLSRIKQKFSAAARKIKNSVPKPHNQDDEPEYGSLISSAAEDPLGEPFSCAQQEVADAADKVDSESF